MADDGGDIVVRVGAQGTGAEADGVGGGVVELYNFVEVLLGMGDAGQAEDRPGRVVGVAGHDDPAFLAGGNDAVQEVLVVGPQVVGGDGLVPLQGGLQLRQAVRFPAGQGKAVAVLYGVAHQVHGGHGPQLRLVKVQAVGAVLWNQAGQVGAQPVKDGHEVVDNDLDAVFCQIADGNAIVFDVLVAGGQAHFNVLVDVDRFNDLAFQTRGMDLVDIGADFLLRPDLSGSLVVQEAHQAGHAGNLLNLAQGHAVTVGTVPTERHFHVSILLKLPVFPVGRAPDRSGFLI